MENSSKETSVLGGNNRDVVEGRRDESGREAEPSEAGFHTLPRARSHTLAPTAAREPRSSRALGCGRGSLVSGVGERALDLPTQLKNAPKDQTVSK